MGQAVGQLSSRAPAGWARCQNHSVTDSPRFISVETVATELAISNSQVYTLLRSGDLPAIQVGPKRVWRIERTKLEEYIEQQYAAARDAVAKGQVEPDQD